MPGRAAKQKLFIGGDRVRKGPPVVQAIPRNYTGPVTNVPGAQRVRTDVPIKSPGPMPEGNTVKMTSRPSTPEDHAQVAAAKQQRAQQVADFKSKIKVNVATPITYQGKQYKVIEPAGAYLDRQRRAEAAAAKPAIQPGSIAARAAVRRPSQPAATGMQATRSPMPTRSATRKALDPGEAQFREESRKLRARAGRSRKRPFGRKGVLHAFGKGGETATGGVRSRDGATGTITGAAVARTLHDARTQHPAGKDVTRFGITTVASKPSRLSHQERERLRQKRMDRMAGKSLLQVMSIDDYHASLMKAEGGPPAPGGAPAPGTGAPKRFPRKEKPTVKMKPISDQEAMANLKAGKYHEKSLVMLQAIKALATGYGKVSGGGALRAANRGNLTLDDLQRAMQAMPKPAGSKPPTTYLPGVHSPDSPMRQKKGKSKPSEKTGGGSRAMAALKEDLGSTAKACCDDCSDASSMEPDLKKEKTAKSLGESMVADGWQPVVHKSEGDHSMSKTNFNDLFKSELGIANDEPLIDCPHCEAPITKSDLSKASLAKQAGPGATRGGDGKGQVKGVRGVPGAKKTDEPVGVQNSKGSKAHKSDVESNDVEKSDEQPVVVQPAQTQQVKKSIVGVRGTEFVQYVDYGDAPGGDAYIAKSIAEAQGALGQQATQPMDLNNDLSRLLV